MDLVGFLDPRRLGGAEVREATTMVDNERLRHISNKCCKILFSYRQIILKGQQFLELVPGLLHDLNLHDVLTCVVCSYSQNVHVNVFRRLSLYQVTLSSQLFISQLHFGNICHEAVFFHGYQQFQSELKTHTKDLFI